MAVPGAPPRTRLTGQRWALATNARAGQRRAAVVNQRRMRCLLPVLVALGVVCMHTLGHGSGQQHASAAGSTHAEAHVDDMSMASAASPALTQSTVGSAVSPTGPHPGMPLIPLSVCMAILATALILLHLVLVRLASRRPLRRSSDRHFAVIGAAGRGPPPRRLGLRLAHLSVQRT
jgi:hypothetical protein